MAELTPRPDKYKAAGIGVVPPELGVVDTLNKPIAPLLNSATLTTDVAGNVGINGFTLANPALTGTQQAALNSVAAPYLLANTNALPMQYNPADPQCVFARTLLQAPTTAPAALEVGTANAITVNNGIYDANLGVTFNGTAGQALGIDLSTIAALQSATAYMVYFEVERGLIAALPSSSGLSSTADYAGGIPLTASVAELLALWPSAEGAGSSGMTLRGNLTYTSGTGAKSLSWYNQGASINGFIVNDISRPDGDTHVPVVIAVDGTQYQIYIDGQTWIVNAATIQSGQQGPLKTLVFGRGWSVDSNPSYQDGHIRNVMVIAGRSPFYGKSYGAQSLTPASVFSNTLPFGDSYAVPQSQAPGVTFANLATGLALPGYLRKYGYGTPNLNDQNNTLTNSTVNSTIAFTGRRLIGWATAKGVTPTGGTTGAPGAPVNAASMDTTAFPTGSGQTYLWDQLPTFLTNSPTCVIMQSGTNDQGPNCRAADYARWLKYYLEYFFGLNGNSATSVQAVAIATTPLPPLLQDGTTGYRRKACIEEFNGIQAAVQWFRQTYPALANYVTIADVFTAFGGANPYQEYFGKLAGGGGVADHPGVAGKYVQGQVWAQALLNLQSQIAGTAQLPSSVTPIAQSLRAYQGNPLNQIRLLGQLRGANFNVTTDQAIYLDQPNTHPSSTKYLITAILVTNASTSLTTAAGGVYTAASKGGTVLVASSQVYTALTASNIPLALTLAAGATGVVYATQNTTNAQGLLQTTPIYLSLTTAQGAAATADVYVFGYDLT